MKKCDFFPVWRARSGSGGNRPWIVGLFSSDWTSYDFASEASSRVRPNPIASHRARSLRASAPRATVRQRDVGRCQLFGACAPNPVTNPSRPPDRSLEMAAWLAPSIRSPTGNGSSPRHGVRLDRTPGDDAVYVEAARANLRARRARGFLERRVTRLSLPALRPRPRPTVPSPSVEWLKKYPLPSIALQAYWRIAGMSYLKYSNMCAEVVRASLKEPFFTKVRPQSLSPSRRPTRRGTRPASPISSLAPTRHDAADADDASSRRVHTGEGSRGGVHEGDQVHRR